MKTFSQSLLEELDCQLERIHLETDDPLHYSEQAVKTTVTMLEKLKAFSVRYKFQTTIEEINFFREIKPRFASKLVYYNEIYTIETNRPFGTAKTIRKYYNGELAKLQLYVEDNLEFYRYYKKGNTFLDNNYFIRGKHDVKLTLDSFYFQADHRFSTSHDYKVARIMANDSLKAYLESKLQELDKKNNGEHTRQITEKPLQWTGAKVGIIELIYALHTEGVFNHGTSDLKDLIKYFEKAFAIDLPQFHRTFFEITSRKTERTKFLNVLTEKLVRRMDDLDKI